MSTVLQGMQLGCAWRCSCPHAGHARRSVLVPLAMAQQASSSRADAAKPAKELKVVPLPQPSQTAYEEGQFVEVGTVAGAFGVKGEVRVEISTDNPKKRFAKGKRLYLRAPPVTGLVARMQNTQEAGMISVTSESSKVQFLSKGEEAWILKFRELHDRSQAEQLLQYTLYIDVKDRERLRDPDEFYVQDLVGCRAFLQGSARYVGRVVDVISGTGTHDTLVLQLMLNADDIRNSRTRQCYVPFVKAICPTLDNTLKQLVLDPPEGLLDMFTYKAMRRKLTEQQQAEQLEKLAKTPVPVLGQPLVSSTAASASTSRPETTKPSTASTTQQLAQASAPKQTSAGRQRSQAATPQKQGVAVKESEDDEEEIPEEEEDEVEAEEVDSVQDVNSMSATDKWKLRRRLGVSLAGRQRRPVRRPRPAAE